MPIRVKSAVMTEKPQAVVFDNDGLLLDTEEAWTRAEVTLFARVRRRVHGRAQAHADRLLAHGRGGRSSKRCSSGPARASELIDELIELVMVEALAGVAPRPGAIELLARLERRRGSRWRSPRTPSARSSSGRSRAPACCTTGRSTRSSRRRTSQTPKPAPDIYLEACCRLGADPTRSVALEDSPTGAAAAAAAGMFVIGVPYFAGSEIPGANLLADSLAAAAVAHALGLRGAV